MQSRIPDDTIYRAVPGRRPRRNTTYEHCYRLAGRDGIPHGVAVSALTDTYGITRDLAFKRLCGAFYAGYLTRSYPLQNQGGGGGGGTVTTAATTAKLWPVMPISSATPATVTRASASFSLSRDGRRGWALKGWVRRDGVMETYDCIGITLSDMMSKIENSLERADK